MRIADVLVVSTLAVGCKFAAGSPEVTAGPESAREAPPVSSAELGAWTNVDADASAGVDHPLLADLLREHWRHRLEHSPRFATRLGVHRFDDRLSDPSEAGRAEARAARRRFLAAAKALEGQGLGETDRITRQLFMLEQESAIAREVCRFDEWTVSPRGNPVTEFNDLPQQHQINSARDADNLLARYGQIAAHIDANVARLKQGAADGLFANAESTRRVIEMVDRQVAQPLDEWPLLSPVARLHSGELKVTVSPTFAADLRGVVVDEIKPALQRYRTFLAEEIAPHARSQKETGIGALPVGKACYDALVRSNTSLPLTPEEVHHTGLAEIKKIDGEIEALGRRALGTRTLAATLKRLRTDPNLHFRTEQEVEDAAAQALADAKEAMPRVFGRLPRADCVVERIPDYEAPFTTIAYYNPPHADGSKPGEYFINVYDPRTRPRYEARVLAVHESIPGHHLQIAIAQELPAVPAFRRHGGHTVFVEGWALYTERMAEEMGMYRNDLDRLGMLSFDAWRAARLVVDTGIHALGWGREQAKAFMKAHTALALNNIDNEVDRYIVWPGQALAYKTGQLEIWKLREEAQATLGDAFDLRAFHDVVLGAGALPLPLLRARVEAYLAGGSSG